MRLAVMASFEGSHAPRRAVATPSAPIWRTKPRVSDPDESCEHEANRAAEAVLRASESDAITAAAGIAMTGHASRAVRRTCDGCVDEASATRAPQTVGTVGVAPAPSREQRVALPSLQRGGQPLIPAVRTFFETRFGRDLGQVRVHTDRAAARSANAINARAYTVGQDIVFAGGEYALENVTGKRLMAHELAHTMQQARSRLVQRKNGDGHPATAVELYETYQDDLPALGEELYRLVSESVDNVDLALRVIDEVPWMSRDDVAYSFVQPVPEEMLSELAVDPAVRDLLTRLRQELAGGTPWPAEKREVAKIDRALSAAAPSSLSSPTFPMPSFRESVPAFPLKRDLILDFEGDATETLYWNAKAAWSWLEAEPSTAMQLLESMRSTARTMQPLIECVTTRVDSVGVDALECLVAELGYAVERLSEQPASVFDDMRYSFETIADAIITLDPTLAELEEAGSVGSCVSVVLLPLARGLGEAVSALEPEQAKAFAANITDNPFFGPGFTLGAQAGMLLEARDVIFEILAAVMDPAAASSALRDSMEKFAALVDELCGPTGADVAEEIGRSVGQQLTAEIEELNKANGQFMFAFELGKVVGPSIIYTVLSLLGFEAVVVGRLLHLAEGALTRLKSFAALARSLRRSPDADLPGVERVLPEGSLPKGHGSETDPDPHERALLERTGRISGELGDDDAVTELAIALTRDRVPFSDPELPDYIAEVDLGNGHHWRLSRSGVWCRFSETPSTCMATFLGDVRAALEEKIRTKLKKRIATLTADIEGKKGDPVKMAKEIKWRQEWLEQPSLIDDPRVAGDCGEACQLASEIARRDYGDRMELGQVDLLEGLTHHTFAVAKVIDERGGEHLYLVDPTVVQYINDQSPWEPGESLVGTMMRGDNGLPGHVDNWDVIDAEINELAKRTGFRDRLRTDGYVELTPDVARVYVWAVTERTEKFADVEWLLRRVIPGQP
jgi:uncharacterized protein DUF4157